jgi:hypothetical protein
VVRCGAVWCGVLQKSGLDVQAFNDVEAVHSTMSKWEQKSGKGKLLEKKFDF